MAAGITADDVETLQNIVIDAATYGSTDNVTYVDLRTRLLAERTLEPRLPKFLRTCRSLSHVRTHMQDLASGYKERREIIRTAFAPLLDHLEGLDVLPVAQDPGATRLETFDSVQIAWRRAQERARTDPDAAITSARELLESVCKCILDETKIEYPHDADLPKLYRLASSELKLAPDQHLEEVFKQILGGCKSVVEGLGALRNKSGDAHGKGIRHVRPKERHAALAVNLAGAVAIFFIETRDARRVAERPPAG